MKYPNSRSIQKQLPVIFFFLTLLIFVGPINFIHAQSRPNILIVIADDMGTDAFSAYGIGTDQPNTPNLDNLLGEGILFMNAWAYGTCAPSRASLLTGRYGNKNGVMRSGPNLPGNEVTLFEHIEAITSDEYADAVFGKWHLGNANHPNNNGADHYDGNLSSGVADYFEWDRTINGNTQISTDYVTTSTTDEAINWIDGQTDPWLCWVAYNAPHTPIHLPPDSLYTRTATNSNFDKYMCMIESVDHEFGRIYNSLTQQEKDSTIILFMGDNGTSNSQLQGYPNQHGKGTLYEGGIRVPMFITGYGVDRVNEQEDALINFVDIFATVTELLGTEVPGGIDNSFSFFDLLSDPNAPTQTYNYSELESGDQTDRAIRNIQYKLILRADGTQEFYDLLADPYEETDLVLGGLTAAQQLILDELQAEADSIFNTWSCNDAIQNDNEDEIDCGGTSCENCAVLNVDLAYFQAIKKPENVLLVWKTSAELNNEKFVIEASQDALLWQKIGEVEGNGTTDLEHHYTFNDNRPNRKNYYRLVQIDFDDSYSYSDAVYVEYENNFEAKILFSPNPVSSYLKVYLNGQSPTKLRIYDISGKIVYHQAQYDSSQSIDFSQMKLGIYFVEVTTLNGTKRQKIIKIPAY